MLRHAAEATAAGYVLTCEIPDVEETIDMNVFEAAGSQPSEPLEYKDHPMMGKE
jgi:hypothetical protein